MDILRHHIISKRVEITSPGSATVFAAIDNARWNLVGGYVAWRTLTTGAGCFLLEQDATATGNTWFVQASATSGNTHFFVGDIGVQSSSSNSRLAFSVDSSGTVIGMFTGYYTGN